MVGSPENVQALIYDSKLPEHPVHRAALHGEHGCRHGEHQNPADKVRDGGHSLNEFSVSPVLHLVQQDCQEHGEEGGQVIQRAHHHRVAQHPEQLPPGHRILEHAGEIPKSHECAVAQLPPRLIVIERIAPPGQRKVAEDGIGNDKWQDAQKQPHTRLQSLFPSSRQSSIHHRHLLYSMIPISFFHYSTVFGQYIYK